MAFYCSPNIGVLACGAPSGFLQQHLGKTTFCSSSTPTAMKAGGIGDRHTVRLTCEDLGIYGRNADLFLEKVSGEVRFAEEREQRYACGVLQRG